VEKKKTLEDLVESEGDESSVADIRKMMIRMFDKLKEELKEDIQKQLNESQENIDKEQRNNYMNSKGFQ
jgi:hypothetical protein